MPYRYLLDFFTKGNVRSIRAKKNIAASMFIKGISIVVSFLLVSITLEYIDQTRYGIWLTLTSILTWFEFFELGLGKGLRNKLSEAIALGEKGLAKVYVSTTYAIIAIIIVLFALIFNLINPFLSWSKILNTPIPMDSELFLLSTIVFGSFFIRFILDILTNVLFAYQIPAVANAFGPISNLLGLIAVYILTKTTEGSLLYLGLAMSISPVIVFSLASVITYSGKLKEIRPSIRAVNFMYARSLISYGIKFFVLSFCSIILYQLSNIIIAQNFGPAEVTPYNIAYKYFGTIRIVFGIIITPLWAAYTEAWTLKDFEWIKNSTNKIFKLWLLISLLAIIMLVVSNQFYLIWVGKKIQVPFILSAIMALFNITFTFGGLYAQFMNGIGKIKLQLYSSVIGAFLFLPLTYLFIKVFSFGTAGIVLATILSNYYGPFLSYFQYKKIIEGKAKGIWNK